MARRGSDGRLQLVEGRLVRSIGADRVIDYTCEDFARGLQRYDVILDMIGNHSLFQVRRALTRKGTYLQVGGPSGKWFKPLDRLFKNILLSSVVQQKLAMVMARPSEQDLEMLGDLVTQKTIAPVIGADSS